jgi:hypothetical protein
MCVGYFRLGFYFMINSFSFFLTSSYCVCAPQSRPAASLILYGCGCFGLDSLRVNKVCIQNGEWVMMGSFLIVPLYIGHFLLKSESVLYEVGSF